MRERLEMALIRRWCFRILRLYSVFTCEASAIGWKGKLASLAATSHQEESDKNKLREKKKEKEGKSIER